METSSPSVHVLSSNNMMQESKTSKWTDEQNKWFESALAIFDTETPDRWSNVAALVPGKSEYDVRKQYEVLKADINDIEAGLVPVPGYLTFKLELVEDRGFNSFGNRLFWSRSFYQERRNGIPWTEEEHKTRRDVVEVVRDKRIGKTKGYWHSHHHYLSLWVCQSYVAEVVLEVFPGRF